MDLRPIVHEYRLRCSAEHAFQVYAGRIGEWWDPDYTADPATFRGMAIEPFEGGRVHITHDDAAYTVGWVTRWEPGSTLAYESTLAQGRDHPSEVTVRFRPDGAGCLVRFEHGGWTDHNAAYRVKFGDWQRILGRFAALAEQVLRELDVELADGRVLHVYDTGGGPLAVLWHHGTPNIGAPPAPLFAAASRLGIRWVSHDRPGYGGSTARPGRDVASAAADASAVADALGIDRFAVMGHSGGGPHALACGALLGGRVLAVVSVSALAPFPADGLDWFAGMSDAGVASLRAAVLGRAAKEEYEAMASDADPGFTPADHAALAGAWSWVLDVVRPAIAAGPAALVDDDLAFVAPWGFDPASITAPVLLVHGAQDRLVPSSHALWLAERCPTAELLLTPDDGHVSILDSTPAALEWLLRHS
jgi:pimeloyl-ACP methyl ester carboxylesterase